MNRSDVELPMPQSPKAVIGWRPLLLAACFLLLWLALPHGLTAAEHVTVYTYHTHPPFIVGSKRGLTYDLAAYLTKHSGGRYTFSVRETSRPALNKMIATPLTGMVPWVNPIWFQDLDKTKYLWSAHVLMLDRNAVISRHDKRIEYDGPASLAGLTLGGIKGHRYAGVDDYIRDTKALRRLDADRHLDNFQKLIKKRIDVTLTPESAALYLIKRENLGDTLYLSLQPRTASTSDGSS